MKNTVMVEKKVLRKELDKASAIVDKEEKQRSKSRNGVRGTKT